MLRVLTTLTFAAAALPAAACPQYDTIVSAVQGQDTAGARVLYEEIVFSAACDDAIREWVGDYLARESFFAARDATDPARKRALLEEALTFEKHWRSYAELGRLSWEARDYPDAARNLQLALNELSEGDQSHAAAPEEIAEVYDLATAAVALAETAVDMPKTRSGQTGGIFQTSFRGFEVEEVSLPITFKYDSTEFDDVGRDYANALVEHIALAAPPAIRLGGHTDPLGSEDYNLALSEARAETVRQLLLSKGYAGQITVEGHGETMLPPAPPGIEPNSPEHFRIARRVAFSAE
ncbi:OmpA family protein [Alphaproteobacteria bacterium GH1-50]|uniref:OmpA family protein n=1 Tax=Kangsaoukella pontilimi TaxID=2691042 RepID=A0A7C9ISF8_9RHOB|nr:OmpA family protein [Kangsaoukella pontilimi]MXQ09743.1 OmpA family protein [Kangsaoukella pontilimi]